MKNISHVDFNIHNIDKVKFVKVTTYPAVGDHLTAKCYVDEDISNIVDESALLRLYPDEKSKLDEQDSIILNSTATSPNTIREKLMKFYVDNFFENSRIDRDLATVSNGQDKEFDKKNQQI